MKLQLPGKKTRYWQVFWLCLLAAAPVAIAGFFHYNGMSLEQFLWAFIKSEILCAGPRRFDSVNLHEELFSDLEGLQE